MPQPDSYYRYALAKLVQILSDPSLSTFSWVVEFAQDADVEDPVQRAWDACADVRVLFNFLGPFRRPIDFNSWDGAPKAVELQGSWASAYKVGNTYEISCASGLVLVCDTKVQVFRTLYNCPLSFDDLLQKIAMSPSAIHA